LLLVACSSPANPPHYGGYEVDYDINHDILELGHGDGSYAWCYAVWTVLNRTLGLLKRLRSGDSEAILDIR
jgi:hypothetical protein